MDPIARMVAAGAAGAAGGAEATYVDDLFSTFLYDGTGSTQSINNGIDLSGEGGLVWVKCRSNAADHRVIDTERGANNILTPNATSANFNNSTIFSSFNSDGFSVATDAATNWSGRDYASWTFRKAPGFFDVVAYTGDGTDNRNISHSLGSTPGMLIIKVLDVSDHWLVWHRSVSGGDILRLNDSGAAGGYSSSIPSSPSSTHFTVSSNVKANQSGRTYVAYVFAHDDQSFGTNSNESIIDCGSFTTNGSGVFTEVNLGWEPQWLLMKRSDSSYAGTWLVMDNMRGLGAGESKFLYPNETNAEASNSVGFVHLTSTGFKPASSTQQQANATYIYMAIRRPHKPPTVGTEVFAIDTSDATSPSPPQFTSGFVTDFIIRKTMNGGNNQIGSRLQGTNYMSTYSSTGEGAASALTWDFMDGWSNSSGVDSNLFCYMFKRAPGFFDVVTYTGTGSLSGVNHNLGVTPELKIIKSRSNTSDWVVGGSTVAGENGYIYLHSDAALVSSTNYWDGGDDSATQFSVRNTNAGSDSSGRTYVAYLFATLDGISKVGSYTGTGSDINVDCGFSAGARFVLIKRTDGGGGQWFVWDTTNGIVSGNDPYWITNDAVAAVTNTDYIDPLNVGFTVTSSAPAALNASGGTYLFLAIA